MPKISSCTIKKGYLHLYKLYLMAKSKITTAKKYDDIRASYHKWLAKKYKNVRIYTDNYVFLKLSEQYYLSPRTIENVVFHRVGYTTSTQGNLFNQG